MKARSFGVIIVLDRASPDGVTNQALDLARYLHSEGISVFLLTGRRDRPIDDIPGVDIRSIPEITRPLIGWFALRGLAGELPVGYRVVHAASASSVPVARVLASKLSLPLSVSVHRNAGGSDAAALRSCRARAIVAVSEAVRVDLVNSVGVDRSVVTMIHDGIVPERYPSAIPDLRDKSRPVIGTLARLVPEKGLPVLLRAAVIVQKDAPGVELVIAGQGPEEKRLGALAGDLGIRDRVSFLFDYVPPESVIPVFDVYVSAALEEGLGLGLIEAAACGKPVIATAVGGAFDAVVDGRTGFLVPPDNPDALAQKILWLLQHPREAAVMGQEGRDMAAEKFAMSATGGAYAALFAELADASPAR
ncbi:MAG: glycosyltransferase family 4 protein [Planctomycetes bacterium]|nr:glycosyltransferase family 4 protein [Planctomycetota bacterium]